AGTEGVTALQATPFGPSFSFTGPEGYRLTVHGD
ncbi:VOC family protein, partial [Streptomyces sp. SID6137]|nr:VOC family protein [Streptomyces sp. SID6137]